MKAFATLADIEALEGRPLSEVATHRTPYQLIRSTAERFPDREAFTYLPDAGLDTLPQRVSYRELLASIHRAANAFRALGVHEQDTVAMLVPNTPEAHAVLWGAQLAGRVCPINFLLQPDHIAALLQASGAKVLVALGPTAELAVWQAALAVQALHATTLVPITVNDAVPGTPSLQERMAEQPDTLTFEPDLNPDRVVALFHTGGTTGAPKLAQHTAGNEAHTAWFAHAFYDMDETAVEVNGFPLFHVAGAFVYGLALLAIGARQVLPTLSGMRNTGFLQRYWQFCERERVTHLACVPTVLASLLSVPVGADISSVRAAFTGGSPLPAELAQRFEAATGIPVRNILGMTECAGLVSIEPLRGPRTPGSAGLRLPCTEVHAVPWRNGEAKLDERCAAGETGVLVLRGPHMSPGYLDAKRNAGLFVHGWIVTGDLGHLDDAGRVHITGRAKDVIIRSSHNIDPGLVEDAFMAHAAVLQCAVVAEPDAYAGEVPVAFVVLRPGAALDADSLLREVAPHVYERLACPRRVVLVDALPLTAIGKVFKPTLRLRAIEIRLGEIARELAPARAVRVEASDEGGRQRALITLGGVDDEALLEKLRAALAAIALTVEIRFG